MANENGGEKLISRIIGDARAEAEKTLQAADEQAQAILNKAEREADKMVSDAKKSAEQAQTAVFDRVRTNAELDSRKLLLKKKRELLDEVFSRAKAEFSALGEDKLTEFYLAVLKKECVGGERIIPASAHEGIVVKAVKAANECFEKKLVSEGVCAADGGFMIVADGYEKDCSLKSMFRMLKESEQSAVAKILFG